MIIVINHIKAKDDQYCWKNKANSESVYCNGIKFNMFLNG